MPQSDKPVDHEHPANERQVGGSHYLNMAIQPWDFIASNDIGYLDGCAIKYLARWKEKGGVEDLRKARHFIDKLIEVEEDRSGASGPRVSQS